MNTVAFFSNRQELDRLEKRADFAQLCLIAITPAADAVASDRHLQYTTIEDYYSEPELNKLGNTTFDPLIEELCDELDIHLDKKYRQFSCSDVFMFIKLLYDQIRINHAWMQGVYTKEKPDKILGFNCTALSPTIFVDNNDDLLLHGIKYYFNTIKKIPIESIQVESINCEKPKHKQHFSIKAMLSRLKFKIENQVYRLRNWSRPSVYVLQHYDFMSCKRLRQHFKLYWKRQIEPNAPKSNSISVEPMLSKKLKQQLTFDGIPYANLVQNKIHFLLHHAPQQFIQFFEFYHQQFLSKRIKAVIAACGQSLDILAGVKAAKSLSIPVIWGQHGGFYGYANFPLMKQLHQHYSHYFLFADAVASINQGVNCYTVSDSHLLNIYQAWSERHAD